MAPPVGSTAWDPSLVWCRRTRGADAYYYYYYYHYYHYGRDGFRPRRLSANTAAENHRRKTTGGKLPAECDVGGKPLRRKANWRKATGGKPPAESHVGGKPRRRKATGGKPPAESDVSGKPPVSNGGGPDKNKREASETWMLSSLVASNQKLLDAPCPPTACEKLPDPYSPICGPSKLKKTFCPHRPPLKHLPFNFEGPHI